MNSSYSSVASSDFSGSPASTRTSATSDSCISPPSRPMSSIQYGISGIHLNMSPQAPLYAEDYVHVPPPITQGYLHVTHDYAQIPSQSNGGSYNGPQYRDNCPAPGYFPLHHSLPEFSTSAPFIAANHGYHARGTESPSAMSIWSCDGAATPAFFDSPCPSPVSMAAHASVSPTPTPSPRALVHRRQRRRVSPNSTRSGTTRRVATAHGLEVEVTAFPKSRFPCTFSGCGRTYARPEHLKRHEKIHDDDAQTFTCEMCLDLMPAEKVHRVKTRLDNFIMHVKNHTDIKGHKTSASRTKYHPGALAYLRSLEAQQKNRGRGTKKSEHLCKL